MTKLLLDLKHKVDSLHTYFFPKQHTISVHHSIYNHNVLFYFRLISLLYLSWMYVWGILTVKSALSNIIYLTMQGYFLTWLFFLLTFQDYMINGNGFIKNKYAILQCKNLKYYIEIIYQIAFCLELPITIVFWGFLFKILMNTQGVTTEDIIINANMHAGPFIVLCIDMALNTFRFPKRHFHAVTLFQLLYGVVNLSYSLAAHIIYKPIDWISFLSYVLILSSVAMSLFMHWIGRLIFRRCKNERTQKMIQKDKLLDEDNHSEKKANKKSKKQNENLMNKNQRESLITQKQ